MADTYDKAHCDERHTGLGKWVKDLDDKVDAHEHRLTALEVKLLLVPWVGAVLGGVSTGVILKVIFK